MNPPDLASGTPPIGNGALSPDSFTPPPHLKSNPQPTAGLRSWRVWLNTRPETLMLLLVVAIGAGTGVAVVWFHYLIEAIANLTLEQLMGAIAPWGSWTLALVPLLGGGIIGLLRWGWHDFGESNPVSHPPTLWQAAAKLTAAAVSLGTGASLGPEGPSVEAGASLGRALSQQLRMSEERRQLLLGAGAAAGLAAGFNAPIAAVFLAMELFLKTTLAAGRIGWVLLAAVVGALMTQSLVGWQPPFTLPVYEFRSFWELPLYLGLGGLASVTAQVFNQSIQLATQLFEGEIQGLGWIGKMPRCLRPLLGGLCLGLVALFVPQILGVGYETVEAILRNVVFALPLLGLLLVVKLSMTAISLGSGLVGGIFAPAMFLGAALGAAYGEVVAFVLPHSWLEIAAPPAYAMVGMAAVLAATVRAPLTAVLLLFELTRDYRIILPLMAAVGVSVLLSEQFRLPPLNLQQMGMPLARNGQSEILETIPVTQAMQAIPVVLTEDLSAVAGLTALTGQSTHSGLVINANGELVGIVNLSDLNRAIAQKQTQIQQSQSPTPTTLTVGKICSQPLVCIYSHESLATALSQMIGRGLHQLPVVTETPPHTLLGLLTLPDISLAYNLALSQQTLAQVIPIADSPAVLLAAE